ncbi:efflux RND transporter permease subunit [Dongia sedimenti]|uniref:Efflux RND transporter permease subunit n=1 Tax=Dongia sedimenti TaxID=3064282 RepID=A0ABU0YSK3_9PROT|nr:efflux RND transporter permease subunit [Rhodospirillaceae bacterium R-7]
MNFATWSIRNPIPVVVLFALLTIAGVWSFVRLPIQDMPDIENPAVKVVLSQPGATPGQLEVEVARPVENAIAPLDRLAHMQTTITEGQVTIEAEFELSKSLSDALSEVKEAVDGVRSTLPDDLEEPSVTEVNVLEDPLQVYAVKSSEMDDEALSWFLDDVVARRITKLAGVGRFERIGGVNREITVEVDPESATAIGVTPMIVSRALESMQQQLSGGRGTLGESDQSVRVSALVPDARSLEHLAISLPGGGYAALGEIARVRDGARDRTQIALLDGRVAVGFRIFSAKGADVTQMAHRVDAELGDLVATTRGLQIVRLSNTVDQTLEQYDGSMDMLYEGGALAMLVVWLFLRDWRATVVAAVALPLSILPAFAGMEALGFSLNTLTLLALAVTIGILVDDVIVEVENIKRHAIAGKPIKQATADAVVEIAIVVLATTLCLVCAFLPTTIMPGVPGMLFKQFGWTAIVAVLCSLLVARLLTPMMAAWLLKPDTKGERADGWLMRIYLATADWCLAHRLVTVAAAALFLTGSVLLVPLIPTGLIPADDVGNTTIDVEMAPGTALEATTGKTEEIRRALAAVSGVEHVLAIVGSGQEPGSGGNTAELLVTLAAKEYRPRLAVVEDQIRDALANVPGARFSVGSGGLGQSAELMLASADANALRVSVRAIEREMRGLAALSNIRSSASLERGEIVIRPDTLRTAERGIATEMIGDSVRVATGGDFDHEVGRLNFENRQVFLRVRLADPVRGDPRALADLRIPGAKGLVPLTSIAAISVESGPTQIDRFDRERTITISADLGSASYGATMAEVMALPSVKALPSSVSFIEAGDSEIAGDLQRGFITAIAAGIVCVYAVLVVLFKDFFQPVTILSAIPFSLGGALALLLISGSELDVPSLIGMVTLIGVVTKNSILLVEYAIMGIQDGGLSVRDALIDACHKRARPIVMTTVAMIAGMAPIAAGLGSDASFRQPMALAVIGGLITSTALSLLIVPVVFSCVLSAKTRVAARILP